MIEVRTKKLIQKYVIDLAIFFVCYALATLVCRIVSSEYELETSSLLYFGIYLVLFVLAYTIFGLERSIWRHFGIRDFVTAMLVSLFTGCIYSLVMMLASFAANDQTYDWILFGLLLTLFTELGTVGVRVICKYYYSTKTKDNAVTKRLAIVGGGSMCHALLSTLDTIQKGTYSPVCIFDDDENKLGARIAGVRIVGGTDKIVDYCKNLKIDEIIIAIPSANSEGFRAIVEKCMDTGCTVNTTPYISELKGSTGTEYWKQVRKIKVEDLLDRPVVLLDDAPVREYVKDRVVLVTGGGGSIGSEICRQVATFSPKRLVILDVYENTAYDIQQELISKHPDLDLRVEIASIRDEVDIERVFATHRPNLVLHAAAHKHVPLMETNPEEAIKNNVFGTMNVITMADRYGVEHFLQISTDKAVNPTNVMGATKRFCEMMVQSMKGRSKTVFAAVRFGNVLGSNGSVIPLFRRQISEGGPVTVTHKDINRFFMTIPEAVRLVLLAGTTAETGNVYVLDMGQPVNIYEFAKKMITLMGYTPDVDVKIEITGLRPGEKLYEELLVNEDRVDKTKFDRVFIEKMPGIAPEVVDDSIVRLKEAISSLDKGKVIRTLTQVVPTYTPDVRFFGDVVSEITREGDTKTA